MTWKSATSTWRRRNCGLYRSVVEIFFLKTRIMWYSPEVDPLGVAGRGSRPMIDDDRPSRQLMRCRASWEQQDGRQRRHQPRIRLGAEIASPLSGNQVGNLPSRKPLKTRETRKFSQRSATLLRGRKAAPCGPGRSRRPIAAKVAGARSRGKFSPLSFEKSENAEILRRHRGAPCLPVDRNPRGRLPLTMASGASALLRNSKAAQSCVCLGRRPDGNRRAIVDFLSRGVSVAVDRGARGLDGETEWPGNGAATV